MAAHWGTFTTPWNYREVLGTAENAMSDHHLDIWDSAPDRDYIVIGGSGDLVVQTTCVPQGNASTWVVVTAISTDSAEAEHARNAIRERIVRVARVGGPAR